MDIAFYYVDSDYIEYLKQYEIRHRGFTCVPNTQYRMSEKFLFGMVMTRNRTLLSRNRRSFMLSM